MCGLILPCPRAPGPNRCRWLVPLLDTFTVNQGPPPGIHGDPHEPSHLHGAASRFLSHHSILARPLSWRTGLFSFSQKGEPRFRPISYPLVGEWPPRFTVCSTLGRKRGLPGASLSFLTGPRPHGAGVLQNECHHLKRDSSREQEWATPSVGTQCRGAALLRTMSWTTWTPTSFPKTSHWICRIQPGDASTTCQHQVQQLYLGGARMDYLRI